MSPPVWIEWCSCGGLTGALSICAEQPAPGAPKPGHEEHVTTYRRLNRDSEPDVMARAAVAFRHYASNPMPRKGEPS